MPAEIANLGEHHTYAVHRVEELQRNIGRMSETAPRAGTVVYPSNWKGEKKKVGDNAWRMENVLQVVALGKMVGNGQVDEVEMAKVADRQPVTLRLDALPDVQLAGTVQSIAKNVQSKSQVDPSKIVHLKIALAPTADTPLRPGMRFRGEIETERLPKVVQVPTEAVFVTADGPVAYRKTRRRHRARAARARAPQRRRASRSCAGSRPATRSRGSIRWRREERSRSRSWCSRRSPRRSCGSCGAPRVRRPRSPCRRWC